MLLRDLFYVVRMVALRSCGTEKPCAKGFFERKRDREMTTTRELFAGAGRDLRSDGTIAMALGSTVSVSRCTDEADLAIFVARGAAVGRQSGGDVLES